MAVDSPPPSQATIAQAIQEVSERAQVIIREEIELAKTEIELKVTKLIKGIAIGVAAGVFAVFGLVYFLHGLSWLAYDVIPFPDGDFFWGFFVVAALLFVLGGLAGYLAARAIKAGSDPAPRMAIEEAKLIRETVQQHDGRDG